MREFMDSFAVTLFVDALYIISAIGCLGVAYLLYRSEDNLLRKYFMHLFLALAWAAVIRTIATHAGHILQENAVQLLVVVPIMVTSTKLFIFLWRQYR